MDSVARAHRIKAFGWSLFALLPGFIAGSPLFAIGGFALAFAGSLIVAEYSGRVGTGLYFPGGSSTKGAREYSLAESLIVRGRLDEAVAELERASARYPDDPDPPMRLARLLRDQCARPVDAVTWFLTAAERGRSEPGAEISALRELVELYTSVLRTPPRALPHLARLASRHADSAAGAWARREIVAIKQSIHEEEAE
ncbi:MAG: hypothetical protein KFH98_07215 [Gemmatimonadetes bacterium]|nr:hypothetical protein [Gemmatimonadota bacterium]